MNATEVQEVLQQLRHRIGQPSVVLRCDCKNLETVYISLTQSGEVLVSDRGETFAYLSTGTDTTYRPMDEIDMVAVAEVCQRSGVVLRCDDPEAYPSIEKVVTPAESVAEAVERVAEAVDQVFEMAVRNR